MPSRFDDVPSLSVESFAFQILTLDAMAHHYGRVVPRRMPALGEACNTADGAYRQLSVAAHMTLVGFLSNPEFEATVHQLIKGSARLNRRHHRRRRRPTPQPPIPTVALALFVELHSTAGDAVPCFPWWWDGGLTPLAEDQPPDLPPRLG